MMMKAVQIKFKPNQINFVRMEELYVDIAELLGVVTL